MAEAREQIDDWWIDFNERFPHSTLGNMTVEHVGGSTEACSSDRLSLELKNRLNPTGSMAYFIDDHLWGQS